MPFTKESMKGLAACYIDAGIDPQALRMHISEIAPGTNAHPPHAHGGIEAFYVLEGSGTLDVAGEIITLHANETIILDASKHHGLFNSGNTPMRYIVIISQP